MREREIQVLNYFTQKLPGMPGTHVMINMNRRAICQGKCQPNEWPALGNTCWHVEKKRSAALEGNLTRLKSFGAGVLECTEQSSRQLWRSTSMLLGLRTIYNSDWLTWLEFTCSSSARAELVVAGKHRKKKKKKLYWFAYLEGGGSSAQDTQHNGLSRLLSAHFAARSLVFWLWLIETLNWTWQINYKLGLRLQKEYSFHELCGAHSFDSPFPPWSPSFIRPPTSAAFICYSSTSFLSPFQVFLFPLGHFSLQASRDRLSYQPASAIIMSKQNKQKRDKSTFALSQPSPVPVRDLPHFREDRPFRPSACWRRVLMPCSREAFSFNLCAVSRAHVHLCCPVDDYRSFYTTIIIGPLILVKLNLVDSVQGIPYQSLGLAAWLWPV